MITDIINKENAVNQKRIRISNSILVFVIIVLISYSLFIQSVAPSLLEADEYYHIAVTKFIKQFGPRYDFHWVRFSTFKDNFSDKDFLFHFLSVPFLAFSKDIVTSGKYAIVFYNILFILSLAFILKKYLPGFLAGVFLLLLFLNSTFLLYFMKLRSITLANILTIWGIYLLINKQWKGAFILSFLYSLSHISFFTIIIFSFACECIRAAFKEGFFVKNFCAVLIGALLGCFFHPNNPNNWLSLHLNGFLVPLYATSSSSIMDFGLEFRPFITDEALRSNFITFFIIYGTLLISFIYRVKLSLSTYVWWACSSFYLLISFLGQRYWYAADALFVIFFASFIKDWVANNSYRVIRLRISCLLISILLISAVFVPINIRVVKLRIKEWSVNSSYFEKIARLMSVKIPPGQTIYHPYWSDSPYFICLNPQNNYMTALDPLYTIYRYPEFYSIYRRLALGKTRQPHKFIKKMFKINYGYTDRRTGLFNQVKADKENFSILYEDDLGIIFKIL